MPENYPNATESLRNIASLQGKYEVVSERGRLRIVRIQPPFFAGCEWWVVNEKGFLWEPASSLEDAERYLEGDEAREYNSPESPG